MSGVFGSKLVMSTRALSPEARLGARLRDLFCRYGSAGGHPIMAKAVIRLASWRADHPFDTEDELAAELGSQLRDALGVAPHSARERQVEQLRVREVRKEDRMLRSAGSDSAEQPDAE